MSDFLQAVVVLVFTKNADPNIIILNNIIILKSIVGIACHPTALVIPGIQQKTATFVHELSHVGTNLKNSDSDFFYISAM